MAATGRQAISPDDPRLEWAGAAALERGDGWAQPWRVPVGDLGLYHELVREKAADPAGVRIRFSSDTRSVAGAIEPVAEMRPLDLCIGGRLAATAEMDGRERFEFADLPAGTKTLELWLPQWGRFRLRSLELDRDAKLEAAPPEARPRWIAYGSSITQCRTAASPTATWPAIVAREAGLDLRCLGFGGQCHLEPMVARLIRDLPADFISICAGINIYGAASLSPRTFRQALVGTVMIIREKHPGIPVTVMSPIYGFDRETAANPVSFTLPAMRAEVRAAVEALREHGDAAVHYVDGLEILGAADAGRLPDRLHPDAAGYRLMGERFFEKVARKLFRGRPAAS